MSDVRLVIREEERDWSGNVHAGTADRAIAALSADPVTLAELEAASGRFEKPSRQHRFLSNLSPGLRDEPYDAGLVVLDLFARLIVVNSTYSFPGSRGPVDYHDGESLTDIPLSYHLADDWLITNVSLHWQSLAEGRRNARRAIPALNTRAVLYGQPLFEYIAREMFAADQAGKTTDESIQQTIREIHVAWMLTPHAHLRGLCPREVILVDREHLTWDLQDQQQHWSRLQTSPPGLEETSDAYRYGGFGTHEIVMYYDLVRELLWSCRDQLVSVLNSTNVPQSITVGDFLTTEVPRFEAVRDEWLATPDPEFHGRTPQSIIHRERTRLPEAMSRHEAIVDPDCPCCQMLADMPGPVFWHLDGCNMDEDFAFDMSHRTREEWEAEQQEWEEVARRGREKRDAQDLSNNADNPFGLTSETTVWSSSHFLTEDASLPPTITLFGIGCHLGELVSHLQSDDGSPTALDAQNLINQLNHNFANLREVVQSTESSLADTLIAPVLEQMIDTLAEVSATHPKLSARSEILASSLVRFFAPHSLDGGWNSDDSDIPF